MTPCLMTRADLLDRMHRIERDWQRLGAVFNLLGAGALLAGYRHSIAVLFAVSLVCQLVSWRASAAVRAQLRARLRKARAA